jgi:hypothetical protein
LGFGCFHRRHVVGVLSLGRLLHCQLVVQIQLGRMHGFSRLFGLPRQFIEFCHSIICGVGLHMPRDDTSEED